MSATKRPVPEFSERVTLVGLSGHEGCLLWQSRQHYWLVPIHTVAALADVDTHLIYDLESRSFVRPTWITDYMHDLEVGWTELTDRPKEREEAEAAGRGHSGPYRALGRLRDRPDDYRGPMHEEIDRCQAAFNTAVAKIAAGG